MDETVRRMEENYARQMEQMRNMIKDISWQHRGSWILGVRTFQHLNLFDSAFVIF